MGLLKIIVSTKPLSIDEETDDVIVVDSFKKATELEGEIDALIVNTTDESETDVSVYLNLLKERGFTSLWYIVNKDEVNQVLYILVKGLGGVLVEDDYFLTSPSLLESLLNSESNSNKDVSMVSSLTVLKEFTDNCLAGNSPNITLAYQNILQGAIAKVKENSELNYNRVLKMATTASDVLISTSESLKLADKENEALQADLHDLKNNLEDLNNSLSFNSVSFFPIIDFLQTADIIRIKDIGRTTYLLSYIFGLKEYLKEVLKKSPKLIVLTPVGNLYLKNYEKYTWVTKEDYMDKKNYTKDIVFTNYPTKEVVTNLLTDNNHDIYIVVDMLETTSKHILNCRRTREVFYALSSKRFIDSVKVVGRKPNFFSSIDLIPGARFKIPYIKSYPEGSYDRAQAYLRRCKDDYSNFIGRTK